MSELALSIILSGWRCPPVECAEVFIDGTYSILCMDGEIFQPLTGPFDHCVRVDIDSDTTT